MASFSQFGNDLYTGKRSVDFVGKRRIWFSIAVLLMILAVAVPFIRGGGNPANGFNFGIDFKGGSQFTVTDLPSSAGDSIHRQDTGTAAVHRIEPKATVVASSLGNNGVQLTTDQLSTKQSDAVSKELVSTFHVTAKKVSQSFIGATWGSDITGAALRGLGIFLLLAAVGLALYFRTWKMSAAALIALVHDLVITVGVYALTGFEITPATVIGFLTVLGYSLYDTVVVFDKIRENTSEWTTDSARTFGETVNLAVNQTLVRSINTGVVAALPVAAILFIGALLFGADTLEDISVALLTGTIIGTYSTPFIASPLYAMFRSGEPTIAKSDKRTLTLRAKSVAS